MARLAADLQLYFATTILFLYFYPRLIMVVNMVKYKFTKEYGFRASAKMLYPYLSTVQGLADWFVDKVWIDDKQIFHFEWQGDALRAIMKTHKVNVFVKYEFFPKTQENAGVKESPNYVEFHLASDELTGTTYLKVIDYSEMNDEVELHELWDNFVYSLKEKVGG